MSSFPWNSLLSLTKASMPHTALPMFLSVNSTCQIHWYFLTSQQSFGEVIFPSFLKHLLFDFGEASSSVFFHLSFPVSLVGSSLTVQLLSFVVPWGSILPPFVCILSPRDSFYSLASKGLLNAKGFHICSSSPDPSLRPPVDSAS